MKKYYYLCATMLLAAWGTASAQSMAGYSVEATVGTYTEIASPTVIPFALDDESMDKFEAGELWLDLKDCVLTGDTVAHTDNFTTVGMPIGFDFNFNGTMMNRFAFSPNGVIVLGKDSVQVNGEDLQYGMTDTNDFGNVIGMVQNAGRKASQETEFSYAVEGEAPNRVFIAQSKNIAICDAFNWDDIPTDHIMVQYQIRLHETTNKIEMVFDGWDRSVSEYSQYSQISRIGVKADATNLATLSSEDGAWDNVSLTFDDTTLSYNSNEYPANGLTYTFTPGGDCAAPATQATALELKSTSIEITGGFVATEDADHYLVTLVAGGEPAEIPTDGMVYEGGDSIGNARVISWSTDTIINTLIDGNSQLQGSTPYTVYVYAANSFCNGSVTYNNVEPLTATITTLPAAPAALTIVDVDKDYIEINAKANAADDQIMIAYTTVCHVNDHAQASEYGAFGVPTTDLAVGDSIDGGGYVMYIGKAGNVKLEELLGDESYHFWAWSYDPELGISSEGVFANDHTAGTIPFAADFTEPYVDMPFGWYSTTDGIGKAEVGRNSSSDEIVVIIQQANASEGNEFFITSPWVYLNEDALGHRVLFDYNMQRFSLFSWASYDTWGEADSLVLQITTDGVTYEDINVIDSKTNQKQSTTDSRISVSADTEKYAGEKVQFRVKWRSTTAARMYLGNFQVEEVLACDYPTNVTVSDVLASNATLSWDSDADNWEIRYRPVGSEEWCAPIAANEKPFTLTGLPGLTDMEVQVRTKCSLTEFSFWSKTVTFSTGYTVPFTFEFMGDAWDNSWTLASGELSDSLSFSDANAFLYYGRFSKFLMLMPTNNINDWLLAPAVDLGDGSVKYNIDINVTTQGKTADSDEVYNIIVSTDGGKTYSADNIIATFTNADLPEDGETMDLSASLNGYKGVIQAALYVTAGETECSQVIINSFSVSASCPSDIVAQVDTITAESAKVSWTSEAEEFLVFSRLAGETTKNYEVLDTTFIELANLEPRTAYEVGITKSCEEGDTAAVTIVSFTTSAPDACEGVSEVSATATQYTATVSWLADAMKYNVRLREKGTEVWNEATTTDSTYTFTGLSAETTYEYAVQSVCSDFEGDQSDWTETAEITTMAITCFAPESIAVVPTHKSATVTWVSDADKFEVDYREGTSGFWTSAVQIEDTTLVITDLTDETTYSLRIKTICSDTDESTWSEVVEFTTTAIPECVTPTNLTATNIDVNSVTLSWEADASNLTWDLRYRASISTTYVNAKELDATTYNVTDLEEETAYIWSVKATCDEGRTSAWATQSTWSTISGISSSAIEEMGVFVSKGVLNVINTENVWINQMDIYSINGKLLNSQRIGAGENILMPLNSDNAQLIVRISGNGWSESYTVIVK